MPKKVDHIERRTLFAKAAISVIAEKGLENLRLVDVARHAGLTTGSLTHYFNDKDQVVAAALDHVIAQSLHTADLGNKGIIPALAAFLPLDEDGHAAARVWLAFFSRSLGTKTLSDMHRQYYDEFVDALVEKLSNDVTTKASDEGDLNTIANLLIALVDGLLVRATLDPRNWPAERQMHHLSRGAEAILAPHFKLEETA